MRLFSLVQLGHAFLAGIIPSPSFASTEYPASTEYQVVIGLAGPSRGTELLIVPDPLVIGRDRPGAAGWRPDSAARAAVRAVEIRFDADSPFIQETASGSADTLITLGPLRYPSELGRFPYSIRLLDSGGTVVGEGSAAVEIRESAGLSLRVYLIAGAIGVVLLLSNYLERKPLTRSYDH